MGWKQYFENANNISNLERLNFLVIKIKTEKRMWNNKWINKQKREVINKNEWNTYDK